jgi:hypothetical protein
MAGLRRSDYRARRAIRMPPPLRGATLRIGTPGRPWLSKGALACLGRPQPVLHQLSVAPERTSADEGNGGTPETGAKLNPKFVEDAHT